jgi:hypothetical protein
MSPNSPSSLCACEQLTDADGYPIPDHYDTTACLIHPITCEALHPETGQGCHLAPGHPGPTHAYEMTWPVAS